MLFFQFFSFSFLLFENAIEFVKPFLEVISFWLSLDKFISHVTVFNFFLVQLIFIGWDGVGELNDLIIFLFENEHFLLQYKEMFGVVFFNFLINFNLFFVK